MADMAGYTSVFRALDGDPHVRRGGPPARRNRQPVSCQACRVRKLKCDRKQPCGSCVKRAGAEAGDETLRQMCRFSTSSSSSPSTVGSGAGVAAHSGSGAPRVEVQLRLQRLEDMVQGLIGAETGRVAPSGGNATAVKMARLSIGSRNGSNNANNANDDGDEDPSSDRRNNRGTLVGEDTATELPYLIPPHKRSNTSPSQDTQDATAYYGATYWAAFLENIQEIKTALEADDMSASVHYVDTTTVAAGQFSPANSHASGSSSSNTPYTPDIMFGSVEPINFQEVLASLPSKRECDLLLATYFNAKFSAVCFIHVNQFRRQYEAFWAEPDSTSLLWISILFSILCAAVRIQSVKCIASSNDPGAVNFAPEGNTTVQSPHFYQVKSIQCLVAGNYLQPKPFAIEALLLYAHSRNMQQTDSDPTIWALFGLLTRLAQRRGYHRDPDKLPRPPSPFEGEMRRRTWFFIETFDLLFSFQLGMPAIVQEDECDTGSPRNIPDDDFDEDCIVLPPERPPSDPSPMLYYKSKSRLCRILRKVVQHALATTRPPYERTLELDEMLHKWKEGLAPCLRIRPIRATSFTDLNYTVMHRVMLELMFRKALCVLHRTYLSYDKHNSRYARSREICRDAALRMLDLHAEFDREIRPGGRLYEDRHTLSSLTLHDFLIAAMVISLDLKESGAEGNEDRARKIAALQTAHGIWASRASASRDATHASRVLGAMLKTVGSTASTVTTTVTTTATRTSSNQSSLGAAMLANSTPVNQASNSMDFSVVGDVLTGVGASGSSDSLPSTVLMPQPDEYPIDLVDFMPLDDVFNDTQNIDWNVIDQYLFIGRGQMGSATNDFSFRDAQ